MSQAELARNSQAITDRLKPAADWSKIKRLHYFEALPGLAEPDVGQFINFIKNSYPNIKLFKPQRVDGDWRAPDDSVKFDVIIVPMLGFESQTLHRLGHGGGYYDRLLAARPAARKIGVCFEQGKLDRLPAEPHDVPLDMVITEERVYSKG